MTVTNSDKNSVIVANRFFTQSQQKDLSTKIAFFGYMFQKT